MTDSLDIKLAALIGVRLSQLVDEIQVECGLNAEQAVEEIVAGLGTMRRMAREGKLAPPPKKR